MFSNDACTSQPPPSLNFSFSITFFCACYPYNTFDVNKNVLIDIKQNENENLIDIRIQNFINLQTNK